MDAAVGDQGLLDGADELAEAPAEEVGAGRARLGDEAGVGLRPRIEREVEAVIDLWIDASRYDLDIGELQLPDRGRQERGLLVDRLDAAHRDVRPARCEDDQREAAAAADVDHRARVAEVREQRERVDDVASDLVARARGGEVDALVPSLEQLDELREGRPRAGCTRRSGGAIDELTP